MYPVTATLSVAVNALTLTVRLAAEAGRVNAVTDGAVVSGGIMGGRVIVTVWLAATAETLPPASLAQGKKVWFPAPVAVTEAGGAAVHPGMLTAGGVAD
jgi:hypothetical protein